MARSGMDVSTAKGRGSMTTDLATVESLILSIPAADVEQLSEAIGKLKALKALVRELDRMFGEKMLERLDAHGPVEVGEVRYYAGFETETLSGDPAEVLTALLEATGGDIGTVAGCLCSQPFKHGCCKAILDLDVYNRLFTTIEKQRAKEGKPQRKVLAANTKFMEAKR
jgi:hypothetical protein